MGGLIPVVASSGEHRCFIGQATGGAGTGVAVSGERCRINGDLQAMQRK
jgi:hypothetical protein